MGGRGRLRSEDQQGLYGTEAERLYLFRQEPLADYRVSPSDKSNMAKYLFGGFKRCLYPVQKFQSDAERKLAVILDREAEKWFKPAKGQFQIFYRQGADHLEYQPDFVAETAGCDLHAGAQGSKPGRVRPPSSI